MSGEIYDGLALLERNLDLPGMRLASADDPQLGCLRRPAPDPRRAQLLVVEMARSDRQPQHAAQRDHLRLQPRRGRYP